MKLFFYVTVILRILSSLLFDLNYLLCIIQICLIQPPTFQRTFFSVGCFLQLFDVARNALMQGSFSGLIMSHEWINVVLNLPNKSSLNCE